MDEGRLRIGELARRANVSADVLRKWESRYGLLRPTRSAGGYRLYSAADARRVELMHRHLGAGLSTAEAATLVLAEQQTDGGLDPAATLAEFEAALHAFQDTRAHQAFDRLVAMFSIEAIVLRAVLPCLDHLGRRWADGSGSIAEEHFATALLRGRLLGLSRGWDGGSGPRALLACPTGELHDLGLICFGLLLRAAGWRITYLGPDTPAEALAGAAQELQPDAIVVAALSRRPLARSAGELCTLAGDWPLFVGGKGADQELAARCGAQLLEGDLASAVRLVAARRT